MPGPQNWNSGNGPSFSVSSSRNPGRLGVAVGELAPVGLVDRARRRADRKAAGHVVPPEQVGAGEGRIAALARLPDLLALDEPVRLPPEPDLHQVAEQPAVADDAVLARQEPGREGRLHAARHRRRDRLERAHAAGRREPRETGRVGAEVAGRQPDGQEDEGRAHRSPWRFARILPTRRAAVNADAACIVRRPKRLTLRSLRAQHRLHREAMSLRRLMKQVAGNHRA